MKKLRLLMMGCLFSIQIHSMEYLDMLTRVPSAIKSLFLYQKTFNDYSKKSEILFSTVSKDNEVAQLSVSNADSQIENFVSRQEYNEALNVLRESLLHEVVSCEEKFDELPKDLPVAAKIDEKHHAKLIGFLKSRKDTLGSLSDSLDSRYECKQDQLAFYENEKALLANQHLVTIHGSLDVIDGIVKIDRTSQGGLFHLMSYLRGSSDTLPKINPLYPLGIVTTATLACCCCFGDRDVVKSAVTTTCTGGSCYLANILYNRFVDAGRLSDLKAARYRLEGAIISACDSQDNKTTTRFTQMRVDRVGEKVDGLTHTLGDVQGTVTAINSRTQNIEQIVGNFEKTLNLSTGEVRGLKATVQELEKSVDGACQQLDRVEKGQTTIQGDQKLILAQQEEVLVGQQELRTQNKILTGKFTDLGLQIKSVVEKTERIENIVTKNGSSVEDLATSFSTLKKEVKDLVTSSEKVASQQQDMLFKTNEVSSNSELALVATKRLEASVKTLSAKQDKSFFDLQQSQKEGFSDLQKRIKAIQPMMSSFQSRRVGSFGIFSQASASVLTGHDFVKSKNQEINPIYTNAATKIQACVRKKAYNKRVLDKTQQNFLTIKTSSLRIEEID